MPSPSRVARRAAWKRTVAGGRNESNSADHPSCQTATNPASFAALPSNVAVARQPSRRLRASIRQSVKSADESFHKYIACSIEGSSSKARSAVSSRAEKAAAISDFGSSYRLRNTHSVSSRTSRLTTTGSPLLNSRSINRRAFSYCGWSSRIKYLMRTLVSTPSINATAVRRARASFPFCTACPRDQMHAYF